MALHALSLCSGIGGLDLALRRLGVVSVGYVERDAYAAAVLVARMEETRLDRAPIWSDLASFDARAWRGRVDLVSAGYPCQPFSVAGKRLGDADERHLWPEVRRIIADCAPALVCLENVAGHVRLGLDAVLGDLAALGFDAEWGVVAASDAGAPHRRERLFILAWRGDGLRLLSGCMAHGDGLRREVERVGWLRNGERAIGGDDADGRGGEELADAEGGGRSQGRTESGGKQGGSHASVSGLPVADSGCTRLEGQDQHQPQQPFPPGPSDCDGWSRVLVRRPDLEPSIRRVAHGIPHRVDRLRCLGNAVVPGQAELAIRELVRRALA